MLFVLTQQTKPIGTNNQTQMKTPLFINLKDSPVLAVAIATLLVAHSANAVDVTWDTLSGDSAVTGGEGTWDLTLAKWSTDGGASNILWDNASNATAVFSGTAGSVTLGVGITVGGLTFHDAPGYLLSGDTLSFGAAGAITTHVDAEIRSAIAGAAITKTGTGTLTLYNENSFTGGLTVSAGKLALSELGTLGATSQPLTVDGATAIVDLAASIQTVGAVVLKNAAQITGGTVLGASFAVESGTISSVLDGAEVPLTKTSAGTVTLSGNSTFSGQVTVEEGTLQVPAVNNSETSGPLGQSALPVILGKSGGSTGTLQFSGATVTASKNFTLASGGSGTFQVDANSLILSGVIDGSGALTKTGPGTLALTGTNTHSGPTTISAGTLQLGSNNGPAGDLGTYSGPITNEGKLFISRSGTLTLPNDITGTIPGNSSLEFGGEMTGTVNLDGSCQFASISVSGNNDLTTPDGVLNIASAVTTGQISSNRSTTVNVNPGANVTCSRYLLCAGGGGPAQLNVYGTMTVQGGDQTVIANQLNGLVGPTLTIKAGGHFHQQSIAGSGSGFVMAGGNQRTYATVTLETDSALTLDPYVGDDSPTGINGFVLVGGSTHTANQGTVNLNGGTLTTGRRIRSIGRGFAVFNFNGGTLKTSQSFDDPANTYGAFVYLMDLNPTQLSGGAPYPRQASTRTNVRDGGAIIDTNGFDSTILEPLSHSNISGDFAIDGGLTKNGSGQLTLAGVGTYNGKTLIHDGTLKLANSLALQNSAFDTSSTGNLDVTATDTPTFGGLLGSINLTLSWNVSSLTLNPGTGVTNTYTGILGSASPGMSLTKTGAGTQEFGGVNTYSGPTTISGGTLALAAAGSIAASSSIELAAGAVLDTSAKPTYAIPSTQPITLHVDGSATGSSGRIKAAGLDISQAAVVLTVDSALDDAAYVLADYAVLTGSSFAAVTPPAGYTINYAYNGGTQIALVSAYDVWASAKGLDGTVGKDKGPNDDPDKDGRSNLQEFAFDGDPLSGANDGKVLGKDVTLASDSSKVLVLTLPVRRGATFSGAAEQVSALIDGVIYTIQGSDTLDAVAWPLAVTEITDADALAIQAGLPTLSDLNNDGTSEWSYRSFRSPGTLTDGDPADFLRAKVTQP